MKYNDLVQPTAKHWSQWTTPKKKYRIACCSCGLVHDVEFYVLLKGGKKLDGRKGQIKYRARRNVRATAAMRRKKK
jgi:hypothetical protein